MQEQTLPLEIEAASDTEIVFTLLLPPPEYQTPGEIAARAPEALAPCPVHGWCICRAEIRVRELLEELVDKALAHRDVQRRCEVTQEAAWTYARGQRTA